MNFLKSSVSQTCLIWPWLSDYRRWRHRHQGERVDVSVYCLPSTDDHVPPHARRRSNFQTARAPARRRPATDVAPTANVTQHSIRPSAPPSYKHYRHSPFLLLLSTFSTRIQQVVSTVT